MKIFKRCWVLLFPFRRMFGMRLSWRMPNEVTSADGGWRFLFAFVAQRPAAAEFCR